ncbi:MAG: F-box protein, partial [Caedimonadaceae bacterium]
MIQKWRRIMKRKLNLFLGASLIASALTFSADASEIQDENDLALAKTSQSPSSLKRSTPEITDISVLPNEILAHILSFVPASDVAQTAGVCRLWHAAAKQHFIYMPIKIDSLESFNAFYHPDNLKDEAAEAARKKVTHLVIDDSSKSIGNINLKTVLASTPRLRALKLNKTSIVIPTPEKAELQSEETKSQPKITGPEIINLDDCAIIKHQDQQSINVALEEAGRYFASILLTNNRLTEVRIARMNGFFSKQILPQLKSAIA